MQGRTILLHFFALPLRHRLVAGGIAVAIGSGMFLWPRYGARPPATTAVLSFDAGAARQADPGVMNAHAKAPAVALAQSILSDGVVRVLTKQAGVSFASNKNEAAEFRSRLDMTQTSARLLRVNYKDTDKKLSAAVANAVANMLVAWIPTAVAPTATSVIPTAASAPSPPGAPPAKPAFGKSDRQRHPLHSQSRQLRELERQLAAAGRKPTASDRQAIASQKTDVAPPPSSTDNEERRTLQSQMSVAQKKLDDLRARYTDEYPDVENTKDDITEIRRKLASLPPVSNEAERAASPPRREPDANETDQLRVERARLRQVILVEKRREAGLRHQTPSSVGNSAWAVQRVSPPLTPQAPIRQSLDPVAGRTWQRPFTLVRLAGDAGAGQSKSGLLWYWPLAGTLLGLLYSGVAMWRYRPMERAAQLGPPVLNESWFSRRPIATEPSGELGLSKQVPSSEQKAMIEAALAECAGRVSGRPTVALHALWALRTFLDVQPLIPSGTGPAVSEASSPGNARESATPRSLSAGNSQPSGVSRGNADALPGVAQSYVLTAVSGTTEEESDEREDPTIAHGA
jgi:hypothetical protein